MRYFLFSFIIAVALVIGIAGSRGKLSRKPPIEVFPDMDRQPKFKPQAETEFFGNGMTDRPLPAHVVPRGRIGV